MSDNLSPITPPQDLEAEKAILGSILLNNKNLDEVVDILSGEHFYDPRHRALYEVMVSLWNQQKPIDAIFLQSYFKSNPQPEYSNLSQDFLVQLVAKASLSSSAKATAGIIKDKFLLRSILEIGDDLKSLALNDQKDPINILDEAQQKLYEISLSSIDKTFVPISEVLGTTFERIQKLSENDQEHRGLSTGFIDLDKILDGFHQSDLVILAARPSMGKTALALEFCQRMAIRSGAGVGIFSLEMSKDQLVDRMLSSVSKVEMRKIRTGKMDETGDNQDFVKLGQGISVLSQAPIWIDDSEGLNILQLRSKARRLKSRFNIGAIMIDYLQLMTGKSGDYKGNRVQEVSDISRGLKMLAKELEVPVIALSQLSRNLESRDDKRPVLSDLRESGSIEQDADVVLFIHREDKYNPETKKKGIADILISKHRNGEVGSVELAWNPQFVSFENLSGARIGHRVER